MKVVAYDPFLTPERAVEMGVEKVDLDDLLRQQLYLSLPVKNLCAEECRGLCPGCGANLNQADCTCGAGEDRSPFAVLRQLQATRKKQ